MLKQSLKRSWLPALVTTVFVTVGTGCGDECVDLYDCRDKGTPPAGQVYACVENKCELRTVTTPEEDAGTDEDAGTNVDAGTDAGTETDAGTDGGTGPQACSPACALTESCDIAANTCTPSSVTTPLADTSGQIAAFITAPAGALTTPLPVSGAFVTFIKPEVAGSAATEAAGFFLQAEANGPAMFVRDSASTTAVAVGDRVTLNVTEKEIISGLNVAKTVTDLTVVSKNHGVWSLDTATPAGLKVDANAVSTFEDGGTTSLYESRLVTVSGKLEAGNGSGAAFTGFPLITTGEQSPSPLLLRVPSTLATDLDLALGCDVAVPTGVVWRFNAAPQVSVFAPEQLTVTSCPAPKLTEARPLSGTEVRLTFSRKIDAASVEAADFGITPSVAVSAATTTGNQVALTTGDLTAGTQYTVTVNGEVKDLAGKAVDATAKTATFTGLTPPPTGPSLVINEIDYDNVGTDNAEFVEIYNRGTAAADLTNVKLVFVNGDSNANPRIEYLKFNLADTKDAQGNAVTSLPAGGYIVAAAEPYFTTATLPAGTLRLVIKSSSNANTDVIQNGSGDGVGLVDDAAGTLLDSVFYEPGAQNPTFSITTAAGVKSLNFEEGARTTASDSNGAVGSLQRSPNGNDTNNNNADFAFVTTVTPGAPTP
ncbi:lamin tail domain-containing protein [Corallococcus interemptor]|uniref:lamin tail domain-containing protein n=1 Tax=Corallococcus interemptor TaxID=2316720 RepID=UPI0035D4D963